MRAPPETRDRASHQPTEHKDTGMNRRSFLQGLGAATAVGPMLKVLTGCSSDVANSPASDEHKYSPNKAPPPAQQLSELSQSENLLGKPVILNGKTKNDQPYSIGITFVGEGTTIRIGDYDYKITAIRETKKGKSTDYGIEEYLSVAGDISVTANNGITVNCLLGSANMSERAWAHLAKRLAGSTAEGEAVHDVTMNIELCLAGKALSAGLIGGEEYFNVVFEVSRSK